MENKQKMGIKEYLPTDPKTWVKTLIIVAVLSVFGVITMLSGKLGGLMGKFRR